MKKAMQKTMRFLIPLFLDFFVILEGFGTPKWMTVGLPMVNTLVRPPPPGDFRPSKNFLNLKTTFWRPPGSILDDFETILGDFLRVI